MPKRSFSTLEDVTNKLKDISLNNNSNFNLINSFKRVCLYNRNYNLENYLENYLEDDQDNQEYQEEITQDKIACFIQRIVLNLRKTNNSQNRSVEKFINSNFRNIILYVFYNLEVKKSNVQYHKLLIEDINNKSYIELDKYNRLLFYILDVKEKLNKKNIKNKTKDLELFKLISFILINKKLLSKLEELRFY